MSDFLTNWILRPDYLPAWLQAIAAVVALALSAFAIWWSGAAERRRNRLEVRGIAVAIYPEIEMLGISTQNVRQGIAELTRRYASLAGQSVAASLQLTASIQLPPMLDRYTDRVFILGDIAGPICLHLIRLVHQYDAFVEQVVARVAMLNVEQWVEAVKQLEAHLTLLDKVIEKCEHEVRPIHDAVKG
jgi:hypothetical protein